MATLLRKCNPYIGVSPLIIQGLQYVGEHIGTVTIDGLLHIVGEYINNIEYNPSNRFDANLINTVGLSAIALNSFEEDINTDDFDSDGLYKLLLGNETDYNAYRSNLTAIENRTFQDCGDGDNVLIQMASLVGKDVAAYWNEQILNPTSSPWETYLPGSFTPRYSNAAIRGAILFQNKGSGLLGVLAAVFTFTCYEMVKDSL